MPFLLPALKHKDALVRRGAVQIIKNIGMERTSSDELLLSLGELVAVLKDLDPKVRDEAALALAEIDPEMKTAVPVLVSVIRSSNKTEETATKPEATPPRASVPSRQADLRFVPETELVVAATTERGPVLKSIVEELRRRRGDRILAGLAHLTIHGDTDIRQTARKQIVQYLTQKPKPVDEQQAVARLKLYKRLDDDGKKARAATLPRANPRPAARAAEDARKFLAGKT